MSAAPSISRSLCTGARTDEPGYAPRKAEQTVLYKVLQEHLETFIERLHADGTGLPSFVVRELRRFLQCGIRSHGFVRVRCPECRHEMAVPFSCKGRGFCPSCGGRFMAQTAAHLVDRVLPDVPFRQWVLTLPFGLRYRAAYDPQVQNTILQTFIRTLKAWHRRRAREAGIVEPRWGAVTVIQRFGSALQLTPHYHTVGMDGVFSIDVLGGRARFHSLPPPTDACVESLVARIAQRVIGALVRRGWLSAEEGWTEPDGLALNEPTVAACYSAAIQGRLAFGERAGQPLDPRGGLPSAAFGQPRGRLRARARGFDLHAAVCMAAGDRLGLERLCRYIARPPIANDRLELTADGRIALHLKTPFSDGSTHILFTPDALIERLCALVPRPRTHRIRYHGLFAPASGFRRLVVPQPMRASSDVASGAAPERPQTGQVPSARTRLRWILWAQLLRRVFDIDVVQCPRCAGRMRVIASIMRADVIQTILRSLGLPAEAPPIRPARPPPEPDLLEYQWV